MTGQSTLNIIKNSYSTRRFPFRDSVSSLLGTEKLEDLHVGYQRSQLSGVSEQLRCRCESALTEEWRLLNEFISDEIEPICGKVLARQKRPTFRFHCAYGAAASSQQINMHHAGNIAGLYSEVYSRGARKLFHRDGDHRVDHRAINLWVPLTALTSENTLWLGGRLEDGNDAVPIRAHLGEYILFDAVSRWHGAVPNCGDVTRVSFDLRLVFDEETEAVKTLRF